LILGVLAVTISYFLLLRLKLIHYFFDQILLRLPLFGKLSQYYNLSNIARTLGLLLKSDVRIVESFSIVAHGTKNLVYREALLATALEISKGQKVSLRLSDKPRLFPPIFSQMLAVGEATGNLSGSLMYVSEMYEEEINDLTKNLTTMLEPILMVVMGIVVGFIAISIITPIYGITQQLTPYK
jgi:type II secretory pathway component PulF